MHMHQLIIKFKMVQDIVSSLGNEVFESPGYYEGVF